jgi:hypothetical protein
VAQRTLGRPLPSPTAEKLRDSREFVAYLAGILDGEGCLRITRCRLRKKPLNSPRHSPSVFVGNTSWALAEFLRDNFGGSIWERSATATRRTVYIWHLCTRVSILAILTAVRPHLLVKGAQADLLIEFITGFSRGRGRGRGGGHGLRVDPAELARRERIYQEVRDLNHLAHGKIGTTRVRDAA